MKIHITSLREKSTGLKNNYKKARDPYIDNARFTLIVLVVFGHLVSPMKGESEAIYLVNNLLASFRMPALIMLTGMFAKSFYKEGYIEKITTKLFVPYLLFQVFYLFLNHYLTNYSFSSFDWFKPFMGMWFLLSVYYWNLLLFVFTRLKQPILIAVFLGVAVGYMDSGFESYNLMRTFVFFPFFLLGFYLNKELLTTFKKPSFKLISIGLFLLIIAVMKITGLEVSRGLLLGKQAYETIGLGIIEGSLLRILFYIIMVFGIAVFLPWISSSERWYTNYGSKTAYIYLFHFVLIKFLQIMGIYVDASPLLVVVAPVIALVVSVLLASRPVILVTKPLVEGTIVKIIKEKGSHVIKNGAATLKTKILRNSSEITYLVFKK
ncbi:acyltransferase family protein [Fredinandcohnia sp. 179-A 10B2 NHS]|uniref:acyltransferase family protein n=1 Tax=Fredinandcohnia sp. 179-A 10B2 NHS TaxID=3235176 RepID=UPI0039A0831E